MGFDNECIVNIQSLAGEYFCPVCRLLVLPNEALQAQCTHLYCKPCMAYTANSTRACPYDGYLVTESDAKPLSESNKALADTINKIAVHCLYQRSGCTWQGSLLECITHCSGCAFGNSPVVCNRCALQIVHRQVQEHAQTCPGVQPQAQATAQTQEATSANAAAMVQSQTANPIPGVSVSSHGTAQTATTVTPTQDAKQQPDPSTQGQAVPVSAEQWYQQQYHQYYQQFGGYEAYQQQYQQFYQQQAASQPQLYPQMQVLPQQPHLQTQAPLPSNPQAPPQQLTSSQSQNQSQPQSQMQQQQQHGQPLLSIQPQAHPSQVQSVTGSQPLNQQQQIQSVVSANQQLQTQNHPSQQYPQAHPQVLQYPSQSHPQQHGQVPVYQQPQVLQLPQLQSQGHPQQQLPPQVHLQQQQQLPPQVRPQQQLPPQQQLIPHPQAPQGQSSQQHQAQQQIPALNPLPQSKIQKTQGVTAYQSYPPLQSHLPMQSGGSQQQKVHVRPPQTTQSIQLQSHLPQPSSQIHPPQFQQQQGLLLPSNLVNIPPAQQTNYYPNQQVGQVVPQRGVMQSVQQHMAPQIGQHQQPPLGGQHVGTTHNQFNQRGASNQLPMRPQISPQGLPHPYQSQQNVLGPNNMQPSHVYQNPAGRPLMPAYGVADHFALNAPVGAQVRPMQPGYNQNNMAGSSKQAPPGKNVTGRHASLPQKSAKMDKKSLATDAGQKRAGMSESDGKVPVGDHKVVSEDDKPGQTEPAGILEEARTINGLQASEGGEASVNQTAKDDSAQRIGEQLDGKVGEVSADKKDPTSDPKAEEKAVVEDKASVDGQQHGTPVQQNDLEGQSQIGGGLVAHPSNSERNALHNMQRQASGFSLEGGPLHQKTAASSLLDPSPLGPLHQPNAPAQIPNHVRPQLKQSHPPHPRMPPTEHLVAGIPPDSFEPPNQRAFHFDGRQSGPNFPGATSLNGQPSDFHANVSMFSQRDERLIYLPNAHMKYPLADPSRRVYDRVFDDELKNSSEHITKFESYLSAGRPFVRGPFDNTVRGPSPNPGDPAASASLRIFTHDRERGPFGPSEPNLGKLDSSRMHSDGFSSGYSRHHMDRFLPRSPGGEYDGFRSRFLDLQNRYPPDLVRKDIHGPNGPIGSSLPESRFSSLPGPFRKSEFDENFRGGEHMRSGDLMGHHDRFPSHIHRGELSGPGRLSNHLRMGEPGSLSSFHDRPRPGEPVEPEIYGARMGEPGHKSTFPLPPYLDEAIYRGGIETFDGLRKRRTISMGWCRLCKVDCETVEGLDVHSQSREHQEMAMDMVRSIKQQNAKKQKQSSSGKSSIGNATSDARGNKH